MSMLLLADLKGALLGWLMGFLSLFLILLILFVLGYLLFRMLKSLLGGRPGTHRSGVGGPSSRATQIDDVMVQDPQCGIYFSKREGVELAREGQTLYFCSPECRDRFVESRSEGSALL